MEISLVHFTNQVRIFAKRIILMLLRMIVLPSMEVYFPRHLFPQYLIVSVCV